MNNSEIFDTLKLFIKLYPEAELRDIYKSFFQDEFGAGHIIDNPVEARSSFDRELEAMDSYGREKAVPCGLGHNFCRIPMDIIIDGKVSADEYFSAFSDDAESFLLPDIEVWKQKWRGIWDLISNFESSLNNFQKDSAEIFSALDSGNYVMHHSSHYRTAYKPHYRVFKKERLFSFLNI